MTARWMTKWGPRRVRYEPPTLVEALDAAADLSTEKDEQIRLAAELMQLPVEDVRADAEAIFKSRSRRRVVSTTIHGSQSRGPVVVERRTPRRFVRAGT
jgi:hypothetical protein